MPGKHLRSHSQLDNSYTTPRLAVPWHQGRVPGAWPKTGAGLQEGHSGGHSTRRAAASTSPPPPSQRAPTATATALPPFASQAFLRKQERGKEVKGKEFSTAELYSTKCMKSL